MRMLRLIVFGAIALLPSCGGGGGGGGDGGPSGGGPAPTPGAPGSLDATFGAAATGKVTVAFGTGDDHAYALVIQSDGKIVVGGSSHNGTNLDFALARFNPDGTLDTTFDSDGKVTTAMGSDDDRILGLALQSDGKIVAGGYLVDGSDFNWALARYHPDGSLDTTFDGDGRVVTSVLDLYIIRAIAMQSDGKIVAGGYAASGGPATFAIARFNGDGSLDATFDTDGIVTVSSGLYPPDICYGLTLQADGKILAAGRAGVLSDFEPCIVRLNPNGSLDTTFDSDGVFHFDFPDNSFPDHMPGIGITSTGSIVMGGSVFSSPSGFDFGAARSLSSGALDTGFSTDGMVVTEIGAGWEEAHALALQGNDKIILAGYSTSGTKENFALVRYNTDGSLDTTFDVDGKLTFNIGSGNDQGQAVALQPDGRIVVAGFTWNGTDYDVAIARIWP